MIIGAPLGLLGLLALPVILVIHLYRRRYRPRPATALFLYGAQRLLPTSGRVRQPLRQRASLWLELAAALAATWWLVDPHLSARAEARHLALVLDTRRSLQARDGDVNVHAQLLALARQQLAGLDRDDRVTLVLSGRQPRLLIGPAARPDAALAALDQWRAEAPWHDLDGAIALARELGGVGSLVSVLSDRDPGTLPAGVGLYARGRAQPTTGLADARWVDDAQGARVIARIAACGGAARERILRLLDQDGHELARQRVTVAPASPALVRFTAPTAARRIGLDLIPAEGSPPDAYPDDDRATLLAPPPRALRVALALTGLARAAVERALAAAGGVAVVAGDEPAHLRIDDGQKQPPPGTWQLAIVAGAARPVLGPFLARRGHPLLADVDCTAAAWSGGGTAGRDDDVLLSAGDTVLLCERRVGRDRLLTLHADLTHRGLTDHPAWPALIANLVAVRRAALPGPARTGLPLGQPLSVALPTGATALQLTAPDGTSARFPADARGEVLLPGFDQVGEHRLDALDAGGAALVERGQAADGWAHVIALPLDPRLADLTSCTRIDRAPDGTGGAQVERSRSLAADLLPLIAAAACAALAWLRFPREEGAQ